MLNFDVLILADKYPQAFLNPRGDDDNRNRRRIQIQIQELAFCKIDCHCMQFREKG